MRRIAPIYADPTSGFAKGQFHYFLDGYSVNAQGKIVHGAGRGFVWDTTEARQLPASTLSEGTGIALARGLESWWTQDAGPPGSLKSHDLLVLSSANPGVARWMLDRLCKERTRWPLYKVDPRSNDGESMRTLVQELNGQDPELRSRAAACLADEYFNIKVHWRTVAANELWIQETYPDYKILCETAQTSGLVLFAQTASEDRAAAATAVRALCLMPVTWKDIVARLEPVLDRCDPATAAEARRAIALVAPITGPQQPKDQKR